MATQQEMEKMIQNGQVQPNRFRKQCSIKYNPNASFEEVKGCADKDLENEAF